MLAFLNDLEHNRRNSVRTRNARLNAVRAFFHHVAARDPASIGVAQRVLAIPAKRCGMPAPQYLKPDELEALLNAPDRGSPRGRRDHALLLFLARTGARISEALGVDAADLHLEPPAQVLLRGKGRKQRMIPLAPDLVRTLKTFCGELGLAATERLPLFRGGRGNGRLTRFGATHVVRRAVIKAAAITPEIMRKSVSPHLLRHTLAMKLLQSGVDLITIQAWLGHAQVATTHRYAEANVEMMRESLNAANVSGQPAARFQATDAVLRLLENH